MKSLLLALFLAISGSLSAADGDNDSTVVTIQLPVDNSTYKPGKGVELAQALCITCHSSEYLSTQPPMPRKFWEGAVKKMKDKFAAPMPDDTTALVDYLVAAYGLPEKQ